MPCCTPWCDLPCPFPFATWSLSRMMTKQNLYIVVVSYIVGVMVLVWHGPIYLVDKYPLPHINPFNERSLRHKALPTLLLSFILCPCHGCTFIACIACLCCTCLGIGCSLWVAWGHWCCKQCLPLLVVSFLDKRIRNYPYVFEYKWQYI